MHYLFFSIRGILIIITKKGDFDMSSIYNAPLDMRTYFKSLPQSVQSAIVHSDASADNLQQLKGLVAGFEGKHCAAEEK